MGLAGPEHSLLWRKILVWLPDRRPLQQHTDNIFRSLYAMRKRTTAGWVHSWHYMEGDHVRAT